ncbi:GTP-binding protein At3g49725, chloroplastic [Salvia miltiorrhiza]|uniref:GTP-binding protein At3g49725, chloroplastic n=1 Tax=Salvia miltiorrhiza TaxID=226208 RepID=UPI0025AD34B1|nr:GTP-binding protein At3g49725, chloroplastic [Salvia miltiorrhiza]
MLRSILHWRSSLPLHSTLNPINPSSTLDFSTIPSQFSPFFRYFSNSNQNQDETYRDPDAPPRLFVVQPRLRPQTHLKVKLEEALCLADSLEQQRDEFSDMKFPDKEMPPHLVVQNPAAKSPRADTYFGLGTVETIRCHITNLEEKEEVDAIFVNATLRGIQQRNLERAWGKPVLDRVGLIIQIFNAHAQTKEAKLQAELAALMCKRSTLVRVRGPDGRHTFGGFGGSGEIEVVSARGRASGGRGFISGAGETEIQLQRRRILERKQKLLTEIADVRRTRAMQRAARKRDERLPGQEIPTVALVGYTNAGKSTLVSRLSNSYLYSDDRLFATVDPKLRSVKLPSGRKVLLSDTVGFISDLPVQLVEAFHATLEEVIEADLLVHVLDSSAPNLDENRESVMEVLRKINVPEEKLQNMIEVWNKVDLLEENSEMCKLDDGQHSSSLPDEKDVDIACDQVTALRDDNQDIDCKDSGDLEEDIYHEQTEDEQESRLSYDDCSNNTVNSQFSGEGEAAIAADISSGFQSESSMLVKTSAVTGVGLQQLLELIDKKLKPCEVVERSSFFHQKWRPPRREDSEVAIQQ